MSSVSRINGFQPVGKFGSPSTFQVNTYFVPDTDATPIFVGDAVKLAGNAREFTGVPTVTAVSGATDIPVGVVVGIAFSGEGDFTNLPPVNDLNTPIYRRANQARYLIVSDDPDMLYEVQWETTGASAATVTAAVGQNGSFQLNGGNTTTGNSGMQLDSTLATTATLPLKVVRIPNREDNKPGDQFISFLVKLNTSQLATGTGTLGV